MAFVLFELRYHLRLWRKHPGFTLAVVATLALGIGANTAIFSVINAVLLQPLPYEDPSELFVLRTELPRQGTSRPKSSPPELSSYLARLSSFEQIGGVWHRSAALTDDAAESEEIAMGFVSAGFLQALGVAPLYGRTIRPEEDVENAPPVALLSYSLWARRYEADPTLVGAAIELDGAAHTVVGIMPEGFDMHFPPDAGVPTHLDAWVAWGGGYDQYPRNWRVLTLIGRLANGVAPASARAEIETLTARLVADFPEAYDTSGLALHLEPLQRDAVAHVEPALMLILGAVGLVLLIACANVANLMLIRASGLQGELALRVALGASRLRILNQLFVEVGLLCLAGAAAGLLLAMWCVDLLVLLEPGAIPRVSSFGLDARVLSFNLVVTVIAALGIGAVTALKVSRRSHCMERDVGAGSWQRPDRQRLRRALVVGEIALSLVVLASAGLLAKSFMRLLAVDPGFDTRGVLTAKLSLVDSHYRYSEPEKIAEFYRQLTDRIEELPGVESVGATTLLPFDGRSYTLAPYAYDTPEGVLEWGSVAADHRVVTPGWFEAMNARLVRGRFFDWTDDLDHPNVAIIDDRLAFQLWPGPGPAGEDAIGQRLQVEIFLNGERGPVWSEVVGVVAHIQHQSSADGDVQIFVPHSQMPMRTMAYALRGPGDASVIADSMRSEVQKLNGDQPMQDPRPLAHYFDQSIADSRFALMLFTLFAGLALVLASIGVYGVMTYNVSSRTHEFGLRLAMGATPGRILGSVVRQGAWLTLSGVAVGLVGSFIVTRYLSSLLFDVNAFDPATFVSVAALLFVVALLGCYLPARRAAKLSPTRALRID